MKFYVLLQYVLCIVFAPIIYVVQIICKLCCTRVLKPVNHTQNIERRNCIKICTVALERNHISIGIASDGIRNEIWMRDAFFACQGAMRLGNKQIVLDTLNTMAKYQRADGLIPLYVGSDGYCKNMCKNYCNHNPNLVKPQYVDYKAHSESSDSCSQFIILVNQYEKLFLKPIGLEEHVHTAIRWLFTHIDFEKTGLLPESYFASWQDTICYTTPTAYANILCYQAFKSYLELCNRNHLIPIYECNTVAENIKHSIYINFWTGSYFKSSLQDNVFSQVDNALAILYKVCLEDHVGLIISYRKSFSRGWLTPPNDRTFSYSMVYFPSSLIGNGKYHNGEIWPWVNCLFLYAMLTNHRNAEYVENELSQLECVVVRYGAMYNVYDSFKKAPFYRIFNKSQINSSKTCGMYIKCVNKMNNVYL